MRESADQAADRENRAQVAQIGLHESLADNATQMRTEAMKVGTAQMEAAADMHTSNNQVKVAEHGVKAAEHGVKAAEHKARSDEAKAKAAAKKPAPKIKPA